ncbi:hypothetical protein FLONG3_4740 [Fusarium longipes]|uniref:Uncharacterized protein n=1 Tax=Fusarium longipes TaxID=694270 RepID=A0A395SZ21_9HYPO|nr:hypothetical protein FLONG3_4740 [Fusarium longipes]
MDDVQPEASALYRDFKAQRDGQDSQQEPWQRRPLVESWQKWFRRQDTTSTDSTEKSTAATSDTTTEDKPTTTEDKSTTEEPTSTTEDSTTELTSNEQSSSSSTVSSTTTSNDSTFASRTMTSLEQGASCYSTTVSTSVVCHITTAGRTESASCITNRMTSSTCAPGLFCEIHPDSGATVCMEQHNDIGTEGIVVASIFAACIAGCMAVLVGMCLRDRRTQKKFEKLQRMKTLKTAKRGEQANLMAGGQI